ncbi:MAG: hypothetical protein HYR70_04240 [Chloroflexi bacterium]|nr:hypothetical protein [Chloroflexota bacterium]MBI3340766.1 hypothetical protein [Chloroflexota bacterium]
MKKTQTIEFSKKNALALLIVLFACVGIFVFAWLGSKKPGDKWNAAATFLPSTPTMTLAPAQGWWTTPSPAIPTP